MTLTSQAIIKRTSAYTIDPRAIVRKEGFNPRFDFGDIDVLAKSIVANGLLQPLRVRKLGDTQFELIDGDRRLTAVTHILDNAKDAAFATASEQIITHGVPVIVVERGLSEVDALVQMFEANTGKNFLPLEAAAAYKRMTDAGLSVADVCKRVGVSDLHVRETMALLDATQVLQDAVASGAIGATVAKAIAYENKGDAEAQTELVEAAKAAKLDKTQRKVLVQKMQDKRAAKAAKAGKVVTGQKNTLAYDRVVELEAKVAALLKAKAKVAKLPTNADSLLAATREDDALVAAFTLGALHALRTVLGNKHDLEL